MPVRPIFWNKGIECVFVAHEKSACKKRLMRPIYSETKIFLFSGV